MRRHPRLTALLLVASALVLLAPVCADPNTTARGPSVDTDSDGVPDAYDNCVDEWNPSQRNSVRGAGEVCIDALATPDPFANPPETFATGTCANDSTAACVSNADCILGDACDCDLDGSGFCNSNDFNLFLTDYQAGTPSGNGSDLDENGVVDDDDFALFEPLFAAGVGGPGASVALVVTPSLAQGACYDEKWARRAYPFEGRVPDNDGILDCSTIDAPFTIPPFVQSLLPISQQVIDAVDIDPDNPTQALVRLVAGTSALSCPNAAFSIGSKTEPRACDAHDLCLDHCGTTADNCNRQFYRDLFNTCEALTGVERPLCYDACIAYAQIYATTISVQAGGLTPIIAPPAGDSTAGPEPNDLNRDLANCQCRPGTCETAADCLPQQTAPRGVACDEGYCVQVYKDQGCVDDLGCPDGYRCELASGDCWNDVRDLPSLVGERPPICGDGVCDPVIEGCQASSCPEDCGSTAIVPGEGRCGIGDTCLLDLDCGEGACLHGVCQRLVDGSVCSDPNECESASCDVITRNCKSGCLVDGDCETGVCQAFQCVDPLPNGSICSSNSDCDSGVCNFPTCIAANSVGPGGTCTTDGACTSGDCQAGFCAGSCGDFSCTVVPDGESCYADSCQADCGACPLGTPCTLDADCNSGFCAGVCFAEGTSGPGRACLLDRECASGDCQAGFCAGSCGDGVCTVVPDGETCYAASCQADCGACPNGIPCTRNSDCASNTCFALFCVSPCASPGTVCALNSACCSGSCSFFTCD